MQLQDILYSQGFGTRRVCAGLIQQGHVQVYEGNSASAPVEFTQAAMEFEANGLRFRVQGEDWAYHEKAYLMLHKPAGTECSQKPSTWPSIYTLLPSPLRLRPNKGAVQGVQAIDQGFGQCGTACGGRFGRQVQRSRLATAGEDGGQASHNGSKAHKG